MGCGCNKKGVTGYVWKSADNTQSQTYQTEVEARARVIREGGTWSAKKG